MLAPPIWELAAPPDTTQSFFPSLRSRAQSTAKQTYSVSDADLAQLGSLRKANPHKADWTPMQLFLESQARGGSGWVVVFGGVAQHHAPRGLLSLRLVAVSWAAWKARVLGVRRSRLMRRSHLHAPPGCLVPQVARLAHDKFGGEEQLQEHQRARADAKLQSKLRVRRRSWLGTLHAAPAAATAAHGRRRCRCRRCCGCSLPEAGSHACGSCDPSVALHMQPSPAPPPGWPAAARGGEGAGAEGGGAAGAHPPADRGGARGGGRRRGGRGQRRRGDLMMKECSQERRVPMT